AVSAVGFGLIGLAPTYALLLALVMISGLGAAAYHPEGYRAATAVAGDRKVTGVSIFSTGGNIGVALRPPLITALVTGLGLAATLGMLIPGAFAALLLAVVLPAVSASAPARSRSTAGGASSTMLKAMSLLVLVITIRSWTHTGF